MAGSVNEELEKLSSRVDLLSPSSWLPAPRALHLLTCTLAAQKLNKRRWHCRPGRGTPPAHLNGGVWPRLEQELGSDQLHRRITNPAEPAVEDRMGA